SEPANTGRNGHIPPDEVRDGVGWGHGRTSGGDRHFEPVRGDSDEVDEMDEAMRAWLAEAERVAQSIEEAAEPDAADTIPREAESTGATETPCTEGDPLHATEEDVTAGGTCT